MSNVTDQLKSAWHGAIKTFSDSEISLIQTTETVNSMSGNVTRTSTSTNLSAAAFNYRERDIDGTNVLIGDRKFYISAKDVADNNLTLSQNDRIDAMGKTWSIIWLRTLRPDVGGDPIGYVARCRQED
jgi:hypothetical protein